jgi:hypothetical protein
MDDDYQSPEEVRAVLLGVEPFDIAKAIRDELSQKDDDWSALTEETGLDDEDFEDEGLDLWTSFGGVPEDFRRKTDADRRCRTCGLIGRCWCEQPCTRCSYPPMRTQRQEGAN